jgi:hypothetical protein
LVDLYVRLRSFFKMLDLYKIHFFPAGWTLDDFHECLNNFANMRLFNRKSLSTLALAGQVVIGLEVEKRNFDVFDYIDPLIGTANGGRRVTILNSN